MNMLKISRLALRIAAFEGDKIEFDPAAAVKDGKLVYKINGTETLVDPQEVFSARSRITALNGEAAGHRKNAETATTKLKEYDGIDPTKAREAFDTLSKIDQKKLIDAGQIDVVRKEIGDSYAGQIAERDKNISTLQTRLNATILGNAFSRSKYIADNIAIPNDIVEKTFAELFSVDADGKITAKDRQGNAIYSRDPNKSGTPADFEEAIQIIISGYPAKDSILKAPNNKGSGNEGNGGNPAPSIKVMKRAEWSAMQERNPTEASAFMAEVRANKAKLID